MPGYGVGGPDDGGGVLSVETDRRRVANDSLVDLLDPAGERHRVAQVPSGVPPAGAPRRPPTRWRFASDHGSSTARPGVEEWRPGRLTADQADEGATDNVTDASGKCKAHL